MIDCTEFSDVLSDMKEEFEKGATIESSECLKKFPEGSIEASIFIRSNKNNTVTFLIHLEKCIEHYNQNGVKLTIVSWNSIHNADYSVINRIDNTAFVTLPYA
jgi:hypothetical protein